MYLSIAIKLLVGMLGVIFFLRISGKTQMAQLTPLDSVNSFVLGALVGGVIYNPDTPVWYLVFAFAVWTAANVSLRYLMRFHRIRRAIKGDSVMLVRDRRLVMREFRRNGLEMEQFRTMLRENGIFSMFDVDDVRFETNGRITISRRNEPPESYPRQRGQGHGRRTRAQRQGQAVAPAPPPAGGVPRCGKTFLRGVDTGTRILYRPAGGTRRPGCGKGNAFGRLRTEQPETAFRTTPGNAP